MNKGYAIKRTSRDVRFILTEGYLHAIMKKSDYIVANM